jgi:O-antigen biosynthesis protein WbqP
MIRIFDVMISIFGLILAAPLLCILCVMGLFDTGSPIFTQKRVGRYQKPFTLIKLRTMKVNTVSVASHLAKSSAITPLGKLLRKTKLDELPQLFNVLKGDMSIVGPRPGLFNQQELTRARSAANIYAVRPGITGLAQVSHIDMSTPTLLATTDKDMIDNLTLTNYFRYIFMTITGSGGGDSVK